MEAADRPRQRRDVAVVTVLHNSRDHLARLLDSLSAHLPDAHLVAVDSGSDDGGAELARAWAGHATVIDAARNIGYGRAVNRGMRDVHEPVTVIVNPDVELLDGSLRALADAALRCPRAIFAPQVVRPDGAREESVHGRPVGAGALLTALVPPLLLPRTLRVRVAPWHARSPRRVTWAVGCCICAATPTLIELGPFDERLFLYGEDLELGLRARELGVDTWFWPQARILHTRAHSTEVAFGGENFELLARQRRAVLELRLGRTRRQADDLIQLLTFGNRLLLKRLLRRPSVREAHQLRALWRLRREPPLPSATS